MTWTAFGLIYVPTIILVILLARSWLPFLLVFSTVCQAAAVVNINSGSGIFGLTPYNATALCCTILFATQVLPNKYFFSQLATLPSEICLFFAYVVIVCAGGLLLPFAFEGELVHSAMNKYGIGQPPTALSFQISNLVQVCNLLLHLACGCFAWRLCMQFPAQKSHIFFGMLASLLVAILVSLYERLSLFGLLPSGAVFWASNLGYEQAGIVGQHNLARIGLPFTEPSYASAFFAAGTVGCLAVALFGKRFILGSALTIASGTALVNSMGTTGWAAAAVGTSGLIALRFASMKDKQIFCSRALAFLCGMILIVACFFWLWKVSPFAAEVSLTLDQLIFEKLSLSSSQARHETNMHSLSLLVQSWGLGVGIGSNRPSSFLASLLSNTGLAGTATFFAMLGTLLWRYRNFYLLSDAQLFVVACLVTITVAMVIGIPDLNLPLYWAFILLAFVYRPHPDGDTELFVSNLTPNGGKIHTERP